MVMSGSSTSTTTYSETLEIEKDGTYAFSVTEMDTSFTYSLSGSGIWYWLKGNKELEYKNKERVGFEELTSTGLYTAGTYSYTDIESHTGDASYAVVYRIDQLKSKEMIVVNEYTEMSGSNITTVTETKTYEKD